MDVKLTIIGEGKVYFSRVVNLPCVIGRGKQSDVTIIHPLFSRRHCEIYEENGVVMTRDLGSLNGTYFHKTRIGRGVVVPYGDHFSIGKLKFKIDPANEPVDAAIPRQPAAPAQPAGVSLDKKRGSAPAQSVSLEKKREPAPAQSVSLEKKKPTAQDYDDQAYSLSLPKTSPDESDSSVLNLDEYLKE